MNQFGAAQPPCNPLHEARPTHLSRSPRTPINHKCSPPPYQSPFNLCLAGHLSPFIIFPLSSLLHAYIHPPTWSNPPLFLSSLFNIHSFPSTLILPLPPLIAMHEFSP
ncbi:hypothetical protein KSP39_PZI014277 [Platanthera zijinensis]|uniref:Uncharacterized protein n=1 Tax=Platanthera zijinensis TaxID=2320716 RepID=A0AAP0BAU5_9ASPA